MSMKFTNIVGVIERNRKFDAIEGTDFDTNWYFKYITQNQNGNDIADYDSSLNGVAGIPQGKDSTIVDYPKPWGDTSGTIFLDSEDDLVWMRSTAETVILDNTPPTVIAENIQYVAVDSGHKCTITFKSECDIDVRNIKIELPGLEGDAGILYEVNRKEQRIVPATFLSDMYIYRKNDRYTLSFTISQNFNDDLLTKHQVKVTVHDVAGNKCEYKTHGIWKCIKITDVPLNRLAHLEISFVDIIPKNKIVRPDVETKVLVKVYNPNKDLWPITPTVRLDSNSVGEIDYSTLSYDPKFGIMTFYVINVKKSGDIIVEAWIKVDNTDLAPTIYSCTYAKNSCGPWICIEEGRLIKMKSYVPRYMQDETFSEYITFVEDFLNTAYTSLSSGFNISVLEKIARINNFNDVQRIEKTLLHQYKEQYGIEIDPNMDDLEYFLDHKSVEYETTYTQVIDNDVSNVSDSENGITISNGDADPVIKTITKTEKKSAYNKDITLDDVVNIMRYTYKTIPYYNQIKGTIKGIKMILNTMGLCCKLVEIWSEHNTISNIANNNLERRADEIGADRYADELPGLADIGKYYLTSRFDVDLMQTDLTFREFNAMSYNIVKIICQVKPVTRTLRKLAYIFAQNTDLHFRHFFLTWQHRQQYHKFDYIWNLYDKYPLSKCEFDTDALMCHKMFIPFKAYDAEVTFATNAEHEWHALRECTNCNGVGYTTVIEDSITRPGPMCTVCNGTGKEDYVESTNGIGDIVTKKATTNTFHNLCNIEYKLELSKQDYIVAKIAYIERRSTQKTSISNTTDGVSYETDVVNELYMNNAKIQDLEETPEYDIRELMEDAKEFKFLMPDAVKLRSATNGFYLEMQNSTIAILKTLGIRESLNEILTNEYVDEDGISTVETIEPIGLFVQMKFDIPLGTKYIALTQQSEDSENDNDEDEEENIIISVPEMNLTDIEVKSTTIKFHLRAIHVGWDVGVDIKVYDKVTGETSWKNLFIANEKNGNKMFSNVPNMSGYEFLNNINDRNKPLWTNDNTDFDMVIDNALFQEGTKLPLFRTYHPDHPEKGYKYSNDEYAFKNIEDIYGDGNVLTYEVQCNDALSYGLSTYDDFAFVIVLNYNG